MFENPKFLSFINYKFHLDIKIEIGFIDSYLLYLFFIYSYTQDFVSLLFVKFRKFYFAE